MNLTITLNDQKILVTPETRLSSAVFSAFRGEGWLWSRTAGAFVFAAGVSGAARVRRLFAGAIAHAWKLRDADDASKAEAASLAFEYGDAETQKFIEQLNAKALADEFATEQQKKAKEDHAAKAQAAERQKIYAATENLPNGWVRKMFYGFMNPCFTTKDFFERGGLFIQGTVPELFSNYGLTAPEGTDDSDVLTLNLNYDFAKAGYNYFNGERCAERRNAVIDITYAHSDGSGALTSTSGNFFASVILAENLKQRTLTGYRQFAEQANADVIALCLRLFTNYTEQHNGEKAVSASFFEHVAGNVSIRLAELRKMFTQVA